jgi:hypothetical protein
MLSHAPASREASRRRFATSFIIAAYLWPIALYVFLATVQVFPIILKIVVAIATCVIQLAGFIRAAGAIKLLLIPSVAMSSWVLKILYEFPSKPFED